MVVTSTFPIHPRVFGGQHRVFQLARELAREIDVTIISLTDAASASHDLTPGLREITVQMSAAHRAENEAVSTRARAPVADIVAATSTELTPEFRAAFELAADGADAVLLAHPYLLPLVQQVAPALPVMYEASNAEWRHKQSILPASPERARLLDIVHDVERELCRAALVVSTPSDRDADALREDYAASQVIVVPNGADLEGTPFVDGDLRRRHTARWISTLASIRGAPMPSSMALFLGSNHGPNVAAAHALVDLAHRVPNVVFTIAGGVSDAVSDVDGVPNLMVAGWITDVVKRGLLQSATIALNPVETGYGTNVKIPEYLAAGAPIVTTPLGARGLELTDGVDALVREIGGFEDAIGALVENPRMGDALAERGRHLVEDRYSWTAAAAEWRERVARALDQHS